MPDSKDKDMEGTKRIMAALVRQPPKTHDEMTGGKTQERRADTKPSRPPALRKQLNRKRDQSDHD